MFSFDNVFSCEEFLVWVVKVECDVVWCVDYFCEFKIDGFVMNLCYVNGVLVSVVICGDGVVGEDVIENVCLIEVILVWLVIEYLLLLVEVWGEVYFLVVVFDELNVV